MKSVFTNRFITLALLILAASFTRLIPHYPNFTAIGAMALFGGAYFQRKSEAFLVPMAALFLTDLILGLHSEMYAVYIAFSIMVVIGFLLREKRTVLSLFFAATASSVIFFVLTNLAVWANGLWYPRTMQGLAACFTAAIPFFHYTYLGDLFFVSCLFGAYEMLRAKRPVLA